MKKGKKTPSIHRNLVQNGSPRTLINQAHLLSKVELVKIAPPFQLVEKNY